MNRIGKWKLQSACCLIALLLFANWAAAINSQVNIIAVGGQLLPGGAGVFGNNFRAPVINDQGQIAFWGVDVSGPGIYRGSPAGVALIAHSGQPSPNGFGPFSAFNDGSQNFASLALNESGQVAFSAEVNNTASNSRGFYRSDGVTTVRIAQAGQLVPDGSGTFEGIGLSTAPAFNNAGQAAFLANLNGTPENAGIFFGSAYANLTQIARKGRFTPDQASFYGSFSGTFEGAPVALNDSGQIAFFSRADGDSIFFGSGSSVSRIAAPGTAAPDGNGRIATISADSPALNEMGQVAFTASLAGASNNSGAAIFRVDQGQLVQLARRGQAAPDGNGVIRNFAQWTLNDRGQVAFRSQSMTGTLGGFSDDEGLFRSDGASTIQVAREGQVVPGGNGRFSDFNTGDPAMNELGQVVFRAGLLNTQRGASDDSGIFLYDDAFGLVQVAREGDLLLGSRITSLGFSAKYSRVDESSGLNNRGTTRVGFSFILEDRREGVAIWSLVPEPGTLMLAMCAIAYGVALCRQRRGA